MGRSSSRSLAPLALLAGASLAFAFGQQADVAPTTPLWRLAEKAAQDVGVGEDFRVVAEHFRGAWPDGRLPAHRLDRVLNVLRHPWQVPETGRELRDALAGSMRSGELIPTAAAWLDLDLPPRTDPGLAALEEAWTRVCDPEIAQAELLEALSDLMRHAHAALESALGGLDEGGLRTLFEGFAPFCAAWHASHAPNAQLDEA